MMFLKLAVLVATAAATFSPKVAQNVSRTLVDTVHLGDGDVGQLYEVSAEGYNTPFLVLNLTATSYERVGYMYGALVGKQSLENMAAIYDTILPEKDLQDVLQVFLEWQFESYGSKQLPQDYIDELNGIREGASHAGVSADDLIRAVTQAMALGGIAVGSVEDDLLYLLESEVERFDGNTLQRLRDAGYNSADIASAIATSRLTSLFSTCSMFGVWGERTIDGRLRSGRNLDWLADSGVAKNKLITVYNVKQRIPYATVSFAGFNGAITGMSARGLTVHEAGFDSKNVTLQGFIWQMRLRELMARTTNLAEATAFWNATNNTMGINHGIGSAADKSFLALETMAGYTAMFGDNDPREATFTAEGERYGFPLQHAVWRTNHGYDSITTHAAVEGIKPGHDSYERYLLLHDTFQGYADTGVSISDMQAINLTAIVGDKGGSSRESFLSCANATGGENIISATYNPDEHGAGTMYIAFENGHNTTHVPACCNFYVRFDMSEYFAAL